MKLVQLFESYTPVYDEKKTQEISRSFPDLEDVKVYTLDHQGQQLYLLTLKRDGYYEVHLHGSDFGTELTGKSKGAPFRVYSTLADMVRKLITAGHNIRIQSEDQKMHHAYTRMVQKNMKPGFQLRGPTMEPGLFGGDYFTSYIERVS